jgi:hypothetical protein
MPEITLMQGHFRLLSNEYKKTNASAGLILPGHFCVLEFLANTA